MLKIKEIINQYKKRKEIKDRVFSHQIVIDPLTEPLVLLDYSTTRWSSQLRCINRLIELKTSINVVMPHPTEFWEDLQHLSQFLTPFAHASDILQKDSSLLINIYQQFKRILDHIKLISHGFLFSQKGEIQKIITRNWRDFIMEEAVIASAIFNFTENISKQFLPTKIDLSMEWIFNFGSEYLDFYKLSQSSSKDTIRRELQSQFSSFTQSSQQFSGISSRVEQIRGADCNAFSTWNPRIVWGMYLHTAPELARVAIAILSIGSSEAAVERTFSIHNIVHSNRRNRLKATAVQREMFIRYNTYAEQLWQTPASKKTNLDYMNDNEDEENDYLFNHISIADESLAEEDEDPEIITNLPITTPNKRRKTPVDDEKRDIPVDDE
jgi:hAT family C-terminal dimerisation region